MGLINGSSINARSINGNEPAASSGVPTAGIKYWNGSTWAIKPLKYWTGATWVEKPLKQWNGSSWA